MPQLPTMPPSYIGCAAEEAQCPLREHCLRSKVYREATGGVMRAPAVTLVNFRNPENQALTEQCRFYRTDRPMRFARGMSHIFDLVPKGKYKAVQQAVQKCFSCRRIYFYCKGGEQLISPREQAAIAEVFQQYGLTEPPRFDEYVDCLNWE